MKIKIFLICVVTIFSGVFNVYAASTKSDVKVQNNVQINKEKNKPAKKTTAIQAMIHDIGWMMFCE